MLKGVLAFLGDARLMLFTGVSVVALGGGAWVWHDAAVNGAYKRGRADVLNAATFDSTLRVMAGWRRDTSQARTDTVIVRVRTQAAKVDSQAIAAAALARQLPPSLDTVPAVRALKSAVFALTVTVSALRDSIDWRVTQAIARERIASVDLVAAYRAETQTARLAQIRADDWAHALSKRPTRKAQFATGVVGAAVGAVAVIVQQGTR